MLAQLSAHALDRQLRLTDGSGLSRGNRTTPRQVGNLLRAPALLVAKAQPFLDKLEEYGSPHGILELATDEKPAE